MHARGRNPSHTQPKGLRVEEDRWWEVVGQRAQWKQLQCPIEGRTIRTRNVVRQCSQLSVHPSGLC
jgi:hypothetical protein